MTELRDVARREDHSNKGASPSKNEHPLGLEVEDRDEGVVVRSVQADSPSDGAVERGDVLLEVDKKPVKSMRDAVRELGSRRSVR